CLAEEPTDPHVLALAGSGLAALDDPEAESVLRLAALTAPDLPEVRLQYGAYLAREGLFEEALTHLRAAVDLAPDDATIHGELGVAYGLMGNVEDRKSTRLNSSHVKISYAVFCLKKKSNP